MKKLFFLAFCLVHFFRVSAQCEPQLLNCNAAVQACDHSTNDEYYWNEQYWWDALIQTHNLPEGKIDLSLVLRDTCPGSDLQVRCLLFLDLDQNGMQETVVDSDNPPTAGMVNFGNAFNPNYSGGTSRQYDERAIPLNQKWYFSLTEKTVGDTLTYSLQWTNDILNLSELPQLPYGKHKIRWEITSASGYVQVCEKPFEVKDCKAPTVVCLNGLSVNIMPTGLITLWASDFLVYAEDNVTPTGQIKIGIRKSGTGTGFPMDGNGIPIGSVTFNCDELGTQSIELWAVDAMGNADYCLSPLIIQDNNLHCSGDPSIEACAETVCNGVPDDVSFQFVVQSPNLPPASFFDLGACGSINQPLPPDTEVTITAHDDSNPLEGVSSFDMVIIQKHIDGVDLFDTPYQWVAADANNDKVIDTFDIIECKKLILGIYNELPNNTSWRFIDKSYSFPSPDPLSQPFPETIMVNANNLPLTAEFIGVKICDVTCGNLVGFYDVQPENQHLIGVPQPNPTREGTRVPLQLIQSETVLLELTDIAGKHLFSIETKFPEGPALLEIPAFALPNDGLYVWRLRAGEVLRSGKIIRQ